MLIYRNILSFICINILIFTSYSFASNNDFYEEIRNTNSLEKLIMYLDTDNINQIRYVIRVIARSKNQNKKEYLKSMWLYHKLPMDTDTSDKYINPNSKLILAQVLLSMDKPDHPYKDYIKQQVDSKDWKVLSNVAEALAHVDDVDAVLFLVEMCHSKNMLVAVNAARSLVKISKSGESNLLARRKIDALLQNNQLKFIEAIEVLADKNIDINNKVVNKYPISEIDSIIQTYLVNYKYKDAVNKLLPIAENGDSQAQYILGEIYLTGPENIRDYKQSIFWLELSSNQENNAAKFALANAYLFGRGVPKNKTIAIELLENSASSSYQPAIELLEELSK
ncbi:MAG: hypothetical protein HAW67_01435 [Endozoicomonadaceae bacterium]|nr:hypothetical protein [Endozoicomonadaceae bacterium]